MRIGKKLFPYPTINNSKNASCFKNSNFSFAFEDAEDENNLVLKNSHIEIDNPKLIDLFNHGKVGAYVIVECSSTIFRKRYEIGRIPTDIEIPLAELREQVVVSCFMYAKEDFVYSDSDFLDDYSGYEFNIEKYDILGIDDGFTTRIEYDEDKDKKISSIFSVIKNERISKDIMRIEPTARKIIIYLPVEQYNCYENMKNNDNYQEIFFSILTVPALIFCLQSLQDQIKYNDDSIDNIRLNYRWFESIENAYESIYKKELTDDEFKDIDIPELSQKLMNSASVTAISDLFKQEFKNMIGGDIDE